MVYQQNKLNNIWLINHYATDMYKNIGGRHYWFAKELLKRDINPIIICANTFHNSNDKIKVDTFRLYSENILNNIEFIFIKTITATGNGLQRIINMFLFFINLLASSKKIVKTKGIPKYIIASSVHPLTMVAGIILGKRYNVPCICEVRDLWPEAIFKYKGISDESFIGKVLKQCEKWIYIKADAIIFTKEGDIDYIIENKWDSKNNGPIDLNKVFYINNGVNIEEYNKNIETYKLVDQDLDSDKYKVIYVGAIRPVNNVDNIIETARLMKENTNIVFLIYGEGNEKEKLEKKVLELNLKNIKFKGKVEKKYIPYILSKSSINLLNYSSSEYNWSRGNSSNKLFEYIASGKPIISNIKMGYSILNKYKCGIESENNTPEDLRNAILYLIENDKLNEFEKNARIAIKDFDFKKHTDRLLTVLKFVEEKR